MISKYLSLLALLSLFIPLLSNAAQYAGTISKIRGKVEILSNGSATVKGKGPHVKYNGRFYTISEGSVGKKVKLGEVIRTGKRSIVKIIFDNGDQFMVSPGSEYSLSLPSNKREGNALINLTRGKFRAIISKEGPRNKMKVRTRNAAMGVRGTDFFVNSKGFDRSEVSVLRGKVSLKTTTSPQPKNVVNIDPKTNKKTTVKQTAKEVTLETGYSANLVTTPKINDVLNKDKKSIQKIAKMEIRETIVEVKRTSKQKLVSIQKATKIEKVNKTGKADKKVNKVVAKNIAKLEKKAIAVTLKDIKTYTPKLYEKIKKNNVQSTEELNTQVVAAAHKIAPKDIKPDLDDLEDEDLGEDAYDKYFKVE